jgi:nitric oxide reductase large subunit
VYKTQNWKQQHQQTNKQTTMSWTEKLLFGVFLFQAVALIAWLTYLRREVKEEKKKIH